MKILLFDLDMSSKRKAFPNLALMKLSASHKARGDEVYLNFYLAQCDLAYVSCVFSWNKHKGDGYIDQCFVGGSGIDLKAKLSNEVEHIKPDYDLYPDCKWSIGYTSRGCSRNCPWCLVPKKEGNIQAWTSPKEFYDPRFSEMLLLDNNLLASPNWKETLVELAELPVMVDCNQGLDIRVLNDEHIHYLKRVRMKVLRFAFDHISYESAVRIGIEKLLKAEYNKRRLSFYVLIGFPNDDTAIERMKILQGYGVDVYPMIYKDDSGKEPELNLHWDETLSFRGARGNLRKFLRVVGKL